MTSGRMPASSRVRITPMWAQPRAEPLPNARASRRGREFVNMGRSVPAPAQGEATGAQHEDGQCGNQEHALELQAPAAAGGERTEVRSEERRVGKEWREGWWSSQ